MLLSLLKKIYNFFFNKDKVCQEEDNIKNFLLDILNKWEKKNIVNNELYYDILFLFLKYRRDNTNQKTFEEITNPVEFLSNRENSTNNHMKYYILGWYIYENLLNKDK